MSARESAGAFRASRRGSTHSLTDRPLRPHQQLEALADRPRLAGADVVDEPGLTAERDRHQGSRHVADVDEIAPGVEIAGDQGTGLAAGASAAARRIRRTPASAGGPGPTGLKTRATHHLQRRPLGQAGDRRQPLAPAVGLDGIAGIGSRTTGRSAGGTGPSSAAEPARVTRTRRFRARTALSRRIVAQKLPR